MANITLSGLRVLVLGLGDTGLAMARWCHSAGADVRAWDTREHAPKDAPFESQFGAAARLRGDDAKALLEGVGLIGISPGLSPADPQIALLLETAQQRSVAVWGEFEFFAHELAQLAEGGYQPKVLATTGTNGKTTVTSLVGQLCREARQTVRVAGNIRPAVLDALLDAKRSNTLPQVWVLELSSFQLETTDSFAPDAAAFLNLTQDHLDWHGSMQRYLEAKLRIFAHAKTRIVNRDDSAVVKGEQSLKSLQPFERVSFGLSAPCHAGDFGVIEEGGMRWLAYAEALEDEVPLTKKQKRLVEMPMRVVRLMPSEALRIHGDHNVLNALAALALCRSVGLPMAPLLRGLTQYRGESHRVESIAQRDGVDFIDDSKGTNVGATVAALNGLGRKVVLIAGGQGKDQDFSPLSLPIARHARAVVLIGRDRGQIRLAIAKDAAASGVLIEDAESMLEAVQRAAALALSGDAVLLSPACASLDMFRDYVHRADAFRSAVSDLMMEAGQPC
jgi:UDP-N-acetylmuramoylalanine--D-glutamate ligase